MGATVDVTLLTTILAAVLCAFAAWAVVLFLAAIIVAQVEFWRRVIR